MSHNVIITSLKMYIIYGEYKSTTNNNKLKIRQYLYIVPHFNWNFNAFNNFLVKIIAFLSQKIVAVVNKTMESVIVRRFFSF